MKILNIENFLNKIKKKKKIFSKKVLRILNNILMNGDKSLKYYSKKFDGIDFKNIIFKTDSVKFNIKKKVKNDIKFMKERIYLYHYMQRNKIFDKSWFYKDKYFNILGQKSTPIKKIAIYVPAGKTIYPSSLLMSAVPAKIAGVKKIYLISPIKNIISSMSLIYTAKLLGIKKIYRIGGAHAVAAFTFGTKSISSVDKIVGPGNYYVSNAKKILYGNVGIDMYAGPTELMIIFDNSVNIKYVIYDALSQMEHDKLSRVVIISNIYKKILCLKKKILKISKKNKIKADLNFVFVKKIKFAFRAVNKFCPEHLELFLLDSIKYLKYVLNAGSVFLGKNTTECIGDYTAGCNHILPTNFCSRFSSPLGVNDFVKLTNITNVKDRNISKSSITISKLENLTFHYKSLKLRI
ncbi:histidinol dehydrogenase [Candidatus Vidania fulgoroideorum]